MGYVEILTPQQLDTYDHNVGGTALLIGASADEVATAMDPFTDWLGGYELRRSLEPAQHDGHRATLIKVYDSQGAREVGRLVLRPDALLDARLEMVRIFEEAGGRDEWIAQQNEGSDEIKTIELDLSFDSAEDPLFVLTEMTDGLDSISYRIATLRGPGGGNPVIAFTGTDRELRKMLRDSYGADTPEGESVSFYMGD